MSWQKTKISEFLIERKDRFKPDKANELGLPRIEKIDFSGTIYINNFKPTKTGMILVKNGDLVISGINVEKGALAIYKGDTDALATIHYSSYTYDEDRIDIDFLKLYLQSNIFRNILKGQVKGGIKTEIKPKTFLNLEIILPDLTTQNQITSKLNQLEENIKDLNFRCFCNKELITKLRQAILESAIQGKLVEQNTNDEPASELLDRIKIKKEQHLRNGIIKKEKIYDKNINRVAYKLPNTWKWCKFHEIASIASNLVSPNSYLELPHIAPNNIEKGTGKLLYYTSVKNDNVVSYNHYFFAGQILYSKIRPNLSKLLIVEFEGLCSADMYPINSYINTNYLKIYMLSKTFLSYSTMNDTRVAMPKINQDELNNIPVPLPPLNEQERIVKKVDALMQLCDELENENNNAEKFSSELLQSIMQKYFTPEV